MVKDSVKIVEKGGKKMLLNMSIAMAFICCGILVSIYLPNFLINHLTGYENLVPFIYIGVWFFSLGIIAMAVAIIYATFRDMSIVNGGLPQV